jgi:hypothetical protein
MPPSSHYYPPEYKHSVLLFYKSQNKPRSFRSVAKHFGIKGGHQLISQWYTQWNGTPASLEPKSKSGRPPVLSKLEVRDYIGNKITNANRKPEPINYSQIIPSITRELGKKISLRTVQRYGQKIAKAKSKTSIKRTPRECKSKILFHFNFIYFAHSLTRCLLIVFVCLYVSVVRIL